MRTVTLLASDNKTTFTAQVPDDYAGPVVDEHEVEPDPITDDSGDDTSASNSPADSELPEDDESAPAQNAQADAEPTSPSSWMTSDAHVVETWVPSPSIANDAIGGPSFDSPDPVTLGGYIGPTGGSVDDPIVFDHVSDTAPVSTSYSDAGQAVGEEYWSYWNAWSLFDFDSNLRSKPTDWDFVA